MRTILTAALLVAAGPVLAAPPAPATAPAAAAALDGKTFTIALTDPAKSDKTVENLSFAAGQLHSPECDQYGFAASAYTSTSDAMGLHFSSKATSATEGTNLWSGIVKGDAVTGTLTWMKDGQATITYPFAGTLKKP